MLYVYIYILYNQALLVAVHPWDHWREMSRVDQVVLSTKAKAAGWSTGIGQGMGMGQYLDGELGAVGTLGHSTIYIHIYIYAQYLPQCACMYMRIYG